MKYKRLLKKVRGYVRLVAIPIALVLVLFALIFSMPGGEKNVSVFRVQRGDSVSSVARALDKQGIIDSAQLFKWAIRVNGGMVQVGEYDIPKNASVWRVAKMLAQGQVATTSVVIPEGMTVQQIKQYLLTIDKLTGAVDCDGADAVCNLRDGDLFPDTYRVARGTSRLAFLELMRKKMVEVKDSLARTNRVIPKPLKDWNQVMVLASIVQKETPRVREMPIVASVYLNRLNKGMRLQADPTVVYALTNGLGDMQGKPLLRGHLKIESPYNTYRNAGLPPAPIANVGQDAIRAVLRPADTNYLYFVADGKGGHRFSKDYEAHKKNHAAWRKIKNKL